MLVCSVFRMINQCDYSTTTTTPILVWRWYYYNCIDHCILKIMFKTSNINAHCGLFSCLITLMVIYTIYCVRIILAFLVSIWMMAYMFVFCIHPVWCENIIIYMLHIYIYLYILVQFDIINCWFFNTIVNIYACTIVVKLACRW